MAIFLFSVGALAFAATTAVLLRSLTQAGIRERAARIASARLESLRPLPCGSAASGSELVQGIQSAWAFTRSGPLVSAVVTLTYSLNGAPRKEQYSALLPCLP